MTHGEEEAQTKEEEKKRAVSPSTTHIRLYIFFKNILGEGGEIEGNNMRKVMKELCPNTTHGEEAQT